MTRAFCLLILAGASACDAQSITYNATVSWSTREDPEIVSITVDGVPSDQARIGRTFDSFSDAQAWRADVEVQTSSGTTSFELAPTACGGRCNPGVETDARCADVSGETESWYAGLGGYGGDQLTFGARNGNCTGGDSILLWAE